MFDYHEAISKELDSAVAKGGGSKLKVTEVAAEDAGGKRHGVVDQVNKDCRCS